jgi:hypothetical protein
MIIDCIVFVYLTGENKGEEKQEGCKDLASKRLSVKSPSAPPINLSKYPYFN